MTGESGSTMICRASTAGMPRRLSTGPLASFSTWSACSAKAFMSSQELDDHFCSSMTSGSRLQQPVVTDRGRSGRTVVAVFDETRP